MVGRSRIDSPSGTSLAPSTLTKSRTSPTETIIACKLTGCCRSPRLPCSGLGGDTCGRVACASQGMATSAARQREAVGDRDNSVVADQTSGSSRRRLGGRFLGGRLWGLAEHDAANKGLTILARKPRLCRPGGIGNRQSREQVCRQLGRRQRLPGRGLALAGQLRRGRGLGREGLGDCLRRRTGLGRFAAAAASRAFLILSRSLRCDLPTAFE
jgi:hypothetical protein